MENHLEKIAKEVRLKVIEMLYKTHSCHLGSNMSAVEILVALYFKVMKENDVFISSKGWCAAALYTVLSKKGYFDDKALWDYFKKHHLISHEVPGVIFGTGSGGQGLSVAVGIALADRKRKVYCLISDGEMQEGSIWEALWFAERHQLKNLTVIIDWNDWQAFGATKAVSGFTIKKAFSIFQSLGWEGMKISGHDFDYLELALETNPTDKPVFVLCQTIKGKGVSFYENKLESHYFNLTKSQYEQAKKENQ